MIKPIKVGMLISSIDGGDLHARPMVLVQDDYDGTIWFFTRREAAKIYEIEYDRHVCLCFEDHDSETYVSLSGTARLSNDRELMKELWNPMVYAWFPEGPDDPEAALLEIKVHKGEHWDAPKKPLAPVHRTEKAHLFEQKPELIENQKFG